MLVLAVLLPAGQVGATADPDDVRWSDEFALPTVAGFVTSAVVFRGHLVIGGRFDFAGETPVSNLARWGPSGWEPLGTGVDGDVLCLLVHRDTLVVGGRFDRAGGLVVNRIARWDGTSWSAMASGLVDPSSSAEVRDLATWRDTLVAAGSFTRAGAAAVRGLASWDGVRWRELGAVSAGGASQLEVHDGKLHAGGTFVSVDGVECNRIAAWDGARWSPLGAGVRHSAGFSAVSHLASHAEYLYVAGEFDSAGAIAVRHLARWDGATWGDPAFPGPPGVSALFARGDRLLVGTFLGGAIPTWDGASWSWVPAHLRGIPFGFVEGPDGLVAFGNLESHAGWFGGTTGALVVQETPKGWSGVERWTPRMRGIGIYSGVSSLAATPQGVLAAGTFSAAGAPPEWRDVPGLATWDGASWSSLPRLPVRYGATRTVLVDGSATYAGGSYRSDAGGPDRNVGVYRLNDGAWTALDTLSGEVRALTVFRGALYAGCTRRSLADPDADGVYRWNGARWEAVGAAASGHDFPGILAMAVHDDRLVVGGSFHAIGGTAARNVAVWDEAGWSPLGSGLPEQSPGTFAVYALLVHQGALHAGGSVAPPLTAVARWDGTAWNPVGGDMRGTVLSLGTCGGELFAGGFLFSPGRLEHIARWDGGTVWHSLGSGLDGPPRAFLCADDRLFVGGDFARAGSTSSRNFARWDPPVVPGPSPALVSLAARPNPFSSQVRFEWSFATPRAVRVSIHDLAGRRIRVLLDGATAAGPQAVAWDGRDARGVRQRAGVYFVRLEESAGGAQARTVVLLP